MILENIFVFITQRAAKGFRFFSRYAPLVITSIGNYF